MKKRFFIISALILFSFIVTISFVFADTQGPNSPGTMADDATVGTLAWANPNNAKVSDNVYAIVPDSDQWGSFPLDSIIKLVVGGSVVGDNKSTGATWGTTESYVSFGGSADLWGLTPTATQINAPDFGVVVAAIASTNVLSHYLKATNFGFTIPSGATIDGVTAEFERKRTGGFAVGFKANVDHIRITVYYTNATNCWSYNSTAKVLYVPTNCTYYQTGTGYF